MRRWRLRTWFEHIIIDSKIVDIFEFACSKPSKSYKFRPLFQKFIKNLIDFVYFQKKLGSSSRAAARPQRRRRIRACRSRFGKIDNVSNFMDQESFCIQISCFEACQIDTNAFQNQNNILC